MNNTKVLWIVFAVVVLLTAAVTGQVQKSGSKCTGPTPVSATPYAVTLSQVTKTFDEQGTLIDTDQVSSVVATAHDGSLVVDHRAIQSNGVAYRTREISYSNGVGIHAYDDVMRKNTYSSSYNPVQRWQWAIDNCSRDGLPSKELTVQGLRVVRIFEAVDYPLEYSDWALDMGCAPVGFKQREKELPNGYRQASEKAIVAVSQSEEAALFNAGDSLYTEMSPLEQLEAIRLKFNRPDPPARIVQSMQERQNEYMQYRTEKQAPEWANGCCNSR